MRTKRFVTLGVLLALVMTGCRSSDVAGNLVGGLFGGGRIGDVTRAAVAGAADSAQQQWTKFSPEQEYYLGRAVAAEAIATYGLDPNEVNQQYVRTVGAAIVSLSTRLKGTYGGYHFAVLDSDEQNGLSGPGGYVFLTRGALLRARNEEEVAGIISHELGHVSLLHGEKVVRESAKWATNAAAFVKVIAAAAGGNQSSLSADVTKLLGDAAEDLARTLVETGYGSELEFEADREGTYLLYDVGYDAAGIKEYIEAKPGRKMDTWLTHPAAISRIRALEDIVEEYGGPFDGGVGRAARTERFEEFKRRSANWGKTPAEPAVAEDAESDAAPAVGFPSPSGG